MLLIRHNYTKYKKEVLIGLGPYGQIEYNHVESHVKKVLCFVAVCSVDVKFSNGCQTLKFPAASSKASVRLLHVHYCVKS